MTPRAIQRLLASALVLAAVMGTSLSASAQSHDASTPVQTEDQRKAQDHFLRARDLYLGGSYKEAIAELELARKLDPKARDLVLNLAIVHEKLGKYDDAIGYLHALLEMDVTPAERARAEGMIKRIEGAKQRAPVPPKQMPTPDLVRSPPPPPGPPPPPPGPPPHGRWDGFTIAAVVVSGVALTTGAAVGLWAVLERPTDFVTGRDGTYAQFQNKTSSAHSAAIASDVFFGVGIVSAITAAALYFGRTKDVAPSTGITTPTLRASAGPTGGSVGLGGSF